MINIIQIDSRSDAFDALRNAMADPTTWSVRLSGDCNEVKISINAGVWTPALNTASRDRMGPTPVQDARS